MENETRDFLKEMAPQAGFEPATLRLTGGKSAVSRALPPFADPCRTLRQPPQNLAAFQFRPLPGFAALCRPLLHPKGKKRATSQDATPARRVKPRMVANPDTRDLLPATNRHAHCTSSRVSN